MEWVTSLPEPRKKSRAGAALSPRAKRRRDAILAWLDAQEYNR
jgi:hypothetical protein